MNNGSNSSAVCGSCRSTQKIQLLQCDCVLCEPCLSSARATTTVCPGCYLSLPFEEECRSPGVWEIYSSNSSLAMKEDKTFLSTIFVEYSSYLTAAESKTTNSPALKRKVNAQSVMPPLKELPSPGPINAVEVQNKILYGYAPITCCAITVNGLPQSGKSETLNAIFRASMPEAAYKYMFMNKENDHCLKVYDVCAFGAYPFTSFKWSHITKRFSPIFFILSDLARVNALRKLDFNQLEIESLGKNATIFNDEFLDVHFRFLYKECINVHQEIKDGIIDESLLMEGLFAFTCFDIGVSKAVYDFLPLFAFCFKKLIRYTFCSLNKDLNEREGLLQSKYKGSAEQRQVMKHFSRLNYLLRFASGGCDIKRMGDGFKTVMVATTKDEHVDQAKLTQFKTQVNEAAKQVLVEDTIEDEWVVINSSNMESVKNLQKQVEKKISMNKRVRISVPLKWIFLRSLLGTLTSKGNEHILLSFQKISNWAAKLEMNIEEVERFLTTFTEIGSLLYCSVYDSLSRFIIVDIEAFMILLDKLYRPHPSYDTNGWISKYGIVTMDAAKSFFGDISRPVMDILVSLGLAAKLSSYQAEINGECCPVESHFLPNIRTGIIDDEMRQGSLVLRFLTPNKSENEATLSKSILSRHPSSKIKLIATENVNCTKLRINLDAQTSFEIHILYHAREFELRLVNIPRGSPPPTHSIVNTCTTIIEGCCRGMLHEANFKRGVDFSIEFKCLKKQGVYHLSDIMSCGGCQSKLNADEKNHTQWWIAAIEKCKVPLSSEPLRKHELDSLTREFIISRANILTNKLLSDEQETKLKEMLGFKDSVDLAGYQGWDLFIMMFIRWGKVNSALRNPKQELGKIIQEVLDMQ